MVPTIRSATNPESAITPSPFRPVGGKYDERDIDKLPPELLGISSEASSREEKDLGLTRGMLQAWPREKVKIHQSLFAVLENRVVGSSESSENQNVVGSNSVLPLSMILTRLPYTVVHESK